MSKRLYISADYDENSGDRIVVEELYKWSSDNYHKIDFVDMAKVVSGSVAKNPDCRICDLKAEFNRQINASSAVIFVVGDKTQTRTAGSSCTRLTTEYWKCKCTPYKQNTNGVQNCKCPTWHLAGPNEDHCNINSLSYLQHEFEQAKKRGKQIIILYNSKRKQNNWLPSYLSEYANDAIAFWTVDAKGNRIGNYNPIKRALGYE